MKNPYFSTQGMYFQTPGSDIENSINVTAALRIIERYLTEGGHQADVEEALQFIEARFEKSKPITAELRQYIFIDDLFGFDEKGEVCLAIVRRLRKRVGR